MHIWSCYLYEKEDRAPLSDESYDELCKLLLRSWKKLPEWYTKRVTQDDLRSGTGSVVAHNLTQDEIIEAWWWVDEYLPSLISNKPETLDEPQIHVLSHQRQRR